jgi:hypothetical protein
MKYVALAANAERGPKLDRRASRVCYYLGILVSKRAPFVTAALTSSRRIVIERRSGMSLNASASSNDDIALAATSLAASYRRAFPGSLIWNDSEAVVNARSVSRSHSGAR